MRGDMKTQLFIYNFMVMTCGASIALWATELADNLLNGIVFCYTIIYIALKKDKIKFEE